MTPFARARVVAIGGTLLLGLSAPAALAEEPDATGWWSSTSRGAAVPAPPDVPEGGLLVQGLTGDPSGHQAIGALRLELGGRRVDALVLDVADSGATPPAVTACLADADWDAVENGAWDARPAFDCEGGVAGEIDADGDALVFTGIGVLERDGILSLVLVPSAPTRVVIAPPDAATIRLVAERPRERAEDRPEGRTPREGGSSSGERSRPDRGPRPGTASSPLVTAAATPEPVVPTPEVADEPEAPEPSPMATIDPGPALRRGTTAAPSGPSDMPQRRWTALALLGVLGPFVARLAPGGGRLRPRRVPWERTD